MDPTLGNGSVPPPLPESNQSNGSNSTNNSTFSGLGVATKEGSSEQTNQSSENSLNSTCKSLEERKIQNIERQQNNLRVMKRISVICSILMLSIIANIISATLVASPLFTIGIAVSLLLIILSAARGMQLRSNNNLIGLQNMTINVLLHVLKENQLANDISPDNNTDLSSLLNNAIHSSPTKALTNMIIRMSNYDLFENNEMMLKLTDSSKDSVQKELKDFITNVFSNPELTNHLRKLNFNVETLQQSAQNYILDKSINELYATIKANT
jgi:hypothetical protein